MDVKADKALRQTLTEQLAELRRCYEELLATHAGSVLPINDEIDLSEVRRALKPLALRQLQDSPEFDHFCAVVGEEEDPWVPPRDWSVFGADFRMKPPLNWLDRRGFFAGDRPDISAVVDDLLPFVRPGVLRWHELFLLEGVAPDAGRSLALGDRYVLRWVKPPGLPAHTVPGLVRSGGTVAEARARWDEYPRWTNGTDPAGAVQSLTSALNLTVQRPVSVVQAILAVPGWGRRDHRVLRRSPKMTHPCSRKLAQASRTVCVGVGASFGRQW